MKLYYTDITRIIREILPRWDVTQHSRYDFELFERGFRHHSFHPDDNYERLEFLGDTVFHLILSEYLYLRYPDEEGGFLTKLRMQIESGNSMAMLCQKLGIHIYIRARTDVDKMIYEDVFEAFIGAFYLNFGIKESRDFIVTMIEKYFDFAELLFVDNNYKTTLVRYFAKMKWDHPIYDEFEWINDRCHTIIRNDKRKIIGKGIHHIKKNAEQIASMHTLEYLGIAKDGIIDQEWINNNFEEKKKERKNKNPLPVFNKENELIDRDEIAGLLANFEVFYQKKSAALTTRRL